MNLKKAKFTLIAIQITSLVMIFPAAPNARAAVTNLEFVINPYSAGGLAISVPTSETFTSMVTPAVLTNALLTLGAVTVTDTRRGTGSLSWTTSAIASDLISATDTLTASTFSYASGEHSITGGTATVQSLSRISMNLSSMVEQALSILGNHVVSWTPTLTVPVPANKNSGTYVGTITHSVL
jgi:hypothetical protein